MTHPEQLVPDSLGASVYAISGADTVQTARAQTNGQFTLSTLIAGTYTVAIHPDTAYRDTSGTSAMASASPQRPVMIQFTARRAMSEFMRLPASDRAARCARAAARRR